MKTIAEHISDRATLAGILEEAAQLARWLADARALRIPYSGGQFRSRRDQLESLLAQIAEISKGGQ